MMSFSLWMFLYETLSLIKIFEYLISLLLNELSDCPDRDYIARIFIENNMEDKKGTRAV